MGDIALKPCPFCGKTPVIQNIAGSYGYYSPKVGISCCNGISINAETERYDWDKRKHTNITEQSTAHIIDRWNRRTP